MNAYLGWLLTPADDVRGGPAEGWPVAKWSAPPAAALWLSAERLERGDVPLEPSVAKKAKVAALPPHSKSLRWLNTIRKRRHDHTTHLCIRVWPDDPGHKHQSTTQRPALVSAMMENVIVLSEEKAKTQHRQMRNLKSGATKVIRGESSKSLRASP